MHIEFTISEDYWENLEFNQDDLEFLNSHLLEIETPLSPQDLISVLISDRIRREVSLAEKQQSSGNRTYLPKESYSVDEKLVFPALEWRSGAVKEIRPATELNNASFEVISVEFDGGDRREFAMGLDQHVLNNPTEDESSDPLLNPQAVFGNYSDALMEKLTLTLTGNDDFVYIAGRWFPKALIVEVNAGNLNLAEAVLDMAEGKPLPTSEFLDHVGLPEGINSHLAEFSLDLALQQDDRFDEVGSEGEVAWFLKRNEPEEVLNTPLYLRYDEIDYDRDKFTQEMLDLEQYADDELSPGGLVSTKKDNVEVRLIFPHWISGTLPLTPHISRLFPTAYEAPRIRFILIDDDTGEKFPGWVVRNGRYIYGLGEWYRSRSLMPGSYVHVRRGENSGEVIIKSDSHRSNKEWVRTALVGVDGGIVYALLKQSVSAKFDERMMIYLPADISALEKLWEKADSPPLEEIVVDTLRELAKLNPQSHVHATELYSAVNARMRTPPGPILALLASRPWFSHVGDLHYRIDEGKSE